MRIGSAAAFVLALALPFVANAMSVEIEILSGSGGGFSYSWLHTAVGTEVHGFHPSGSKTHALRGTLQGELTESELIIHTSTLQATTLGTGEVLALTLEGTLDFGVPVGESMGFLEYALEGGESGAFEFYNISFGGGPANDIGEHEIHLWGQNFERFGEAGEITARGMDLGGAIRPVPEPSAAMHFAAGGLLLAAVVRVREQAAHAPARPRS
jgi:hypothetical protein